MKDIILKKSIIEYLEKHMPAHRYQHILGVAAAARDLADRNHCDPDEAEIAGLLHDIAKPLPLPEMQALARESFQDTLAEEIMENGGLLHGYAGVALAKRLFHIDNRDILQAIAHHTTGTTSMGVLEKIIFIADYIEVNRDFDGVDALRSAAARDLDFAVLCGFDSTISHLIEEKKFIFIGTVVNRNYQLHYIKMKNKE